MPRTGYGLMSIDPKDGEAKTINLLAHRISLTLFLGRDLVQPHTRHSCHNPPCCNDRHLSEGTAMDNRQDSLDAGRPMVGAGLVATHLLGIYGTAHPRAIYTDDQRLEAVRLWRDEKMKKGEIAKRIGCHYETVSRWIYEAFPDAFRMPASMRRMRRDGWKF